MTITVRSHESGPQYVRETVLISSGSESGSCLELISLMTAKETMPNKIKIMRMGMRKRKGDFLIVGGGVEGGGWADESLDESGGVSGGVVDGVDWAV